MRVGNWVGEREMSRKTEILWDEEISGYSTSEYDGIREREIKIYYIYGEKNQGERVIKERVGEWFILE